MLLFEHDAKELLAVQGVPVPGGIRLEQVPRQEEDETSEKSGPWVVKPQSLGRTSAVADHSVVARSNAEVSAAAVALLGSTIDGRPVHSVRVERQFSPRGHTSLRFQCDPTSARIRITIGAAGLEGEPLDQEGRSTLVAPDPGAVIAGVNRLAASMSTDVRHCVTEAGRMLAPLYFGYEATLLEIAPLMLLADGGWAVGDVMLAIDEHALFRHPELLLLVERHDHAYREVRSRRRYGFENRIIDPKGSVATIAAGAGHGAFLVDEMTACGLEPYNIMDAGFRALNLSDESLGYFLDGLDAVASLRCLFVAIAGDMMDLPDFAQRFARAVADRPRFNLPTVTRLIGTGANVAGDILKQALPDIQVEPKFDTAFNLVAAQTTERSG